MSRGVLRYWRALSLAPPPWPDVGRRTKPPVRVSRAVYGWFALGMLGNVIEIPTTVNATLLTSRGVPVQAAQPVGGKVTFYDTYDGDYQVVDVNGRRWRVTVVDRVATVAAVPTGATQGTTAHGFVS